MISRSLSAYNTATQSDNKIHDDETARKFGFSGGLVPGVEAYGYLSWGPVSAWGLDWLARGHVETRFSKPTYDGDTMTVEFDEDTGEGRLRNQAGDVVSTATATLPDSAPAAPELAAYPVADLPATRPAASAESLAAGKVLGTVRINFPDETAETYLDDVRETLSLYSDEHVAHPGWIARLGNQALFDNVVLGPWIHVGSRIQHFAPVYAGAELEVRTKAAKEYEKSGHRFTELDIAVFDRGTPVASIWHTAIYEPRQVTAG